jgi:hypothetical protein
MDGNQSITLSSEPDECLFPAIGFGIHLLLLGPAKWVVLSRPPCRRSSPFKAGRRRGGYRRGYFGCGGALKNCEEERRGGDNGTTYDS